MKSIERYRLISTLKISKRQMKAFVEVFIEKQIEFAIKTFSYEITTSRRIKSTGWSQVWPNEDLCVRPIKSNDF